MISPPRESFSHPDLFNRQNRWRTKEHKTIVRYIWEMLENLWQTCTKEATTRRTHGLQLGERLKFCPYEIIGGWCKLSADRRRPVCVLALDHCRSSDGEVNGVTEEFSALEVLQMVNVGLRSLSKLPSLPKLHKLELSDNAICGGLEALAQKCPNLTYLDISDNKIGDVAALEALKPLKKLKTLDTSGCKVSTGDDYRDAVFRLLPHITYLDGYDRHDNTAPLSDDQDDDGAGPHGDDEGEDDDDDGGDDDDEEEEEEVGLSYLMKEGIQDDEDDGDYVEEEEDDDEDGDEQPVRGDKRKRDDEDDEDDEDGDDQ
ncbi:acidic leucine-rich nuclear phosphoprotein 32 family member E-like isoform X1 [Syngnathoides biaculeatus]|uniref:acidic leucine-rich nuclear phosphoprotein 32 family member E-like isoform X1 n=2 Tax=Syngnathoides biaculeatus TaxID=300417 RepID=UPI002ADE48A6|nr:acidic leucine-rich nuclear phosphoprotein 32 family member E-like isoform X1 [Syngnathoides biaculeatus]